MKNVMLATILIAAISSISSGANAYTCEQRAQFCEGNGGSRAACFEPSILASCHKTGKYVAPSGKVWSASAGGGPSCEDHKAACSRKGGGDCGGAGALAACHRTGIWIGPSGTRYKASR